MTANNLSVEFMEEFRDREGQCFMINVKDIKINKSTDIFLNSEIDE